MTQVVEPSLPKNLFLKLLSIPTTLKPLLAKKVQASEPTKPHDPVIITTDIIVNIYYSFIKLAIFI